MTIKCSCNGFFFVDLSLSFVCSLVSSCARNVLVKLCYAEFAYHRIGSQVMNRAEVHLLKNLIIGHKYKNTQTHTMSEIFSHSQAIFHPFHGDSIHLFAIFSERTLVARNFAHKNHRRMLSTCWKLPPNGVSMKKRIKNACIQTFIICHSLLFLHIVFKCFQHTLNRW